MASPEEIARRAASDSWMSGYSDSLGQTPAWGGGPPFAPPSVTWPPTLPAPKRRRTGVKLVAVVVAFAVAVGLVNLAWDWFKPDRLEVPVPEGVSFAANGLPEGYEWAGDLQQGGDKLICGPVTWEVIGDTPPGGVTAVEEAVALAGSMTGVTIEPVEDVKIPAVQITFEYVPSNEIRDSSDNATGDTIGMALTYHTSFGITQSEILLDEPYFSRALKADNDEAILVVLHEIGHAFGLGHSDLENSLMYPSASGQTRIFPEDVAAFAKVAPDC